MADGTSSSAAGEGATSPFLALPGAIADVNLGVARAYGNSFAEQRTLVAGNTVVDLSHRGILRISGPDRLGWLDSLLSQKLDRLEPGISAETLLLDPHGHVQHAMRVLDDGQATWLLIDEGFAPALATWLERMRFMKQVEVEDVSSEYATLGFFGNTPESLCEVLVTAHGTSILWQDPWFDVVSGGWQYASAQTPAHAWNYAEAVVPRSALPAIAKLISAGTLGVAGLDALEALRIAAWRPRLATEGDDLLLPHETDWLRTAVHLNKGCYRGQETVAKVHNLGHPPRRLVFLSLDGVEDVLPTPGTVVSLGEKEIGRITSVARHWEEGPIALALIKRSVDVNAELSVASEGVVIPATQVIIVPPEAGREVALPKLPRLGAVTRDS